MNKISITVLSALALFGIAFPATVALANRPSAPAVQEEAPRAASYTHVVEELPGESVTVLDEVKIIGSVARKPAAKKPAGPEMMHVVGLRGQAVDNIHAARRERMTFDFQLGA